MRVIFSTGSLWSYSIERCFELAARAGYDGIELMVDQRWETRRPEHLLGLKDRYGLPIQAVHSPTWPAVPGWPIRAEDRVLATLELAEAIGAEVVVHHLPARMGAGLFVHNGRLSTVPLPWRRPERSYRRWLEEEYQEVQARTPVLLCLENMPAVYSFGMIWDLYYWNTYQRLLQLPRLALDTCHLGTWGIQPARVWPFLEERTGHIHLSNFDGREHRLLTDGDLYMDFFLTQVVSSNYKGTLSIEVSPEELEAGGPDEIVLDRMGGTLQFVRDFIADARPPRLTAPGWPP